MKKLFNILGLAFIVILLFSGTAFANTEGITTKIETGTDTLNITTDQHSAIKGRNQSVSDTYVNQEAGRVTQVTGSSEYGIGVKAGDASADASFGSYGREKGITNKYNITTRTTQVKTPPEPPRDWFDENIWNSKAGDAIKEAFKDMDECDTIRGIYWTENTIPSKPGEEYDISVVRGDKTGIIKKHVKDYFVQWDFTNLTTGKKFSYKKYSEPMDKLRWRFSEVGTYKVVSTPWSKFDVGYYEYYTVTVTDSQGNTHKKTRKRWVHLYYTDEWYYNARKTYQLTIGIHDLNKPVDFPIDPEPTVVPVDELVK